MTDSFRREGDPQENGPHQDAPFGEAWQQGHDRLAHDARATGGAGAYPPPPVHPPTTPGAPYAAPAPGWFEAHQPQPPVPGDVHGATAPSAGHARPRRSFALIAAVAIAAAIIGGGTSAGIQQYLSHRGGSDGGVTGSNVSQSNIGTVSGVAEQVSPSVVRIDTTTAAGQGTGSGIVVTSDGEIVTNNHVVSGATEVQVTMSDGKKYKAKVVGTDPDKDLALIKLEGASGLKAAKFGNSDNLKVGDQVVAIGSPDRLTGTVTSGIVSALNRDVNVPKSEQQSPQNQRQQQGGGGGGWPFSYDGRQFNGNTGQNTTSYKAIQTDASLNPGNSGGALVNMNGEIVGMPSAIYSPSSDSSGAGSVGLGFAIPVNTIKGDLDSLRKGGAGGGDSGNGGNSSGTGNGFGTSY
ncbi:trypsin-like peptidase domain-containing protein [Streptomyces sp. NBC_00536]|uniref:S1C family serine protease n=1 Tax=Streptomyces sp. NBC_00536 TaxID=2975769 RepID=UPI002E7FD9C9|nr:trypsin-like peptidase domain-containing protein [Streptomyces sp. NBC_00536]WUC80333.1 trypsin-like peptidase domain-containing protein [Streptomyces sp. NBC_00536]